MTDTPAPAPETMVCDPGCGLEFEITPAVVRVALPPAKPSATITCPRCWAQYVRAPA